MPLTLFLMNIPQYTGEGALAIKTMILSLLSDPRNNRCHIGMDQ